MTEMTSIPIMVTRHCLICLRHTVPGECFLGIEACPNLCEHKHIGVDTGHNDATVVVIISRTGELVGLASTVPVPTSIGRWPKDWDLPWHNLYLVPIN